MQLTKKNKNGFTLLELMVVVVIIGIFSAVAIPGIMEIRYRNTLTDSAARVRSAAQAIRDLAMKTRQAAVLEVRPDTMWVNLLDGPKCNDAIQKKCVGPLADRNGEVLLYAGGGLGAKAGVKLTHGVVLQMVTPEDAEDAACTATNLEVGNGFALCYGGDGELRFRKDGDQTAACTPGEDAEAPENSFARACTVDPVTGIAAVAFPDGETVSLTDGVVLGLNRYEDGDGDTDAEGEPADVLRLVYVPINAAPYSEIAQ